MTWYSMTAIFYWEAQGKTLPKFERRTTICSASDVMRAEEILLAEAESYQNDHIKFLNEYEIQEIDETLGESPVEIAASITIALNSDSGKIIEPQEFVQQFLNGSRITSCDTFGIEHSWYNRDGASSACYNCNELRDGCLWKD